ncbi:hypothetical protein LCGC14_0833570 [marine sediment metagenome]|uniref:Uncharacterized protein n=1 Tax=marine sediment metagenome TaxID=412755 RepID=A0A0F9PF84_9ZZZZ|nr:MAG: hypothetical protein Lokiarch_35290 [Candidatus Lokiarchaeum sp. GC14_75]
MIGYTTDDISPIMEKITDSTATSLTCADVSAWDETGVVENDGFKIGENTHTVIMDVSSQAGIDIKVYGQTVESPTTVTIRPNLDTGTVEWDNSGGGTHTQDLDEVTTEPTAGDGNYITSGTDQEDDIFDTETVAMGGGGKVVASITLWCYGKRSGLLINALCDIKVGSAWLGVKYPISEFDNAYHWRSVTWDTLSISQTDLDDLQVKFTALRVFGTEDVYVDLFYLNITYGVYAPLNKYMAREFKGAYCMEPLKAVCKLEGYHWYEDYINNRIVMIKPANFPDSGITLTEADYGHDWVYEDECNQVKSFFVFGKSEDAIFAKAVDNTVEGYISKQLIDESITNVADAQDIADTQLALLNSKRPSIKLPLKGVYADLQVGVLVSLTLARPTVAEALYPIRKIERSKFGGEIKTIIYCGLGESTIGEKIAKHIRDNAFRSHKSLTDRLISP